MVKVKIIMSSLNLSADSRPRYSFHVMKLLTRSGFATFIAIYQHLASTTGRNHDNCCLKSGGYQLVIEQILPNRTDFVPTEKDRGNIKKQ